MKVQFAGAVKTYGVRGLASRLGVTPAYVSMVANGKRPLTSELLTRFDCLVNTHQAQFTILPCRSAAGPGFEPGLPDPESGVLPLDHPAVPLYYTRGRSSWQNLRGRLSILSAFAGPHQCAWGTAPCPAPPSSRTGMERPSDHSPLFSTRQQGHLPEKSNAWPIA